MPAPVSAECPKCGAERDRRVLQNGPRKGRGYWYCAPCAGAKTRQWRDDNPERHAEHRARHLVAQRERTKSDPRWAKNKQLMKLYKITLEQFEEMLAVQNGVCAGCGTDTPGGAGTWQVDHDHSCCPGRSSCGQCVRALLCYRCNNVLGLVQDNVGTLLALASYLAQQNVKEHA